MGCCSSTSLQDAPQGEVVLLWPTFGTAPADVMENVAYVQRDLQRWFSNVNTSADEENGLNVEVLHRYLVSLWRNIERTLTLDNASQYQEILMRGYEHLAGYSQGQAVKHEPDLRRLRNHMMLCALEITAGILVLQPPTDDDSYQRRRQSLPIMAWTIIHRLANARMEAGQQPSAPWCGGLVVRTFPSVIASGKWEWQDNSSSSTGAISKMVDSASDGERLLLLAVDIRRRAREGVK